MALIDDDATSLRWLMSDIAMRKTEKLNVVCVNVVLGRLIAV